MSDLVQLVSPRADNVDAILVFVLWTVAFTAAAPFRPQLFLRGRTPELTPERTRAYAWFYSRLAAAAIFGGVAWLGMTLREGGLAAHGFAWGRFDRTIALVAVALALGLAAVYGRSRLGGFADHHPEIRIRRWTGRMISNNRTTWLLYVGGYESLVRGFGLFALADWSGPTTAVAMTTAVDVALRTRHPPSEVLGGAVFALLFGVGALWTGSILGPWVVHAMLILTLETMGRPAAARPSAQPAGQ